MEFGNDFKQYYIWFQNARHFESLSALLESANDKMLVSYFYFYGDILDIFGLELNEISFKICVIVWFILLQLVVIKGLRRNVCWKSIAVFFMVLVGSRLYWEFNSNILRSFSAALLYFVIIVNVKCRKDIGFYYLLLLVLCVLIHAKATVLYLIISVVVYFVTRLKLSNKAYYFVLCGSLIIFTAKFLFGIQIFNVEFLRVYVFELNQSSDINLHSNKISNDNKVPLSLFFQYLVYIFYPLMVSNLCNKTDIEPLTVYTIVSIFSFSVLMPEILLAERISQILLLTSLYIMLTNVHLRKIYVLPLLIANSISLASLIASNQII